MLDRWLTIARLRFRSLAHRRQLDADLDEELEDHLARQIAANLARGMSLDAASRAARVAFGGVQQQREGSRDARGLRWFEDFIQDARYGCRLWIREPRLTLVALLSLALATGANAAVFSLVDALLLRDLPVREPGKLVLLTSGNPTDAWSRAVWDEVAARASPFDGSIAWASDRFDLTAGGRSAFAEGVWVSGSYFPVLGVQPTKGRLIAPNDDRPGAPAGPAAVISHRFWQRHFAGAPDVIGRTMTINGTPCTIVGITAASFFGVDVGRSFDVALPLAQRRTIEPTARDTPVTIMLRLRSNQTVDAATQLLRGLQSQIRAATLPDWPAQFLAGYLKRPFTLLPSGTGASSVRGRYTQPLLAVAVLVGLVLLTACVNLANLSLARMTARRRELAMRLSLGASRSRLVRQLTAESAVLAITGSALGMAVAASSARLLLGLLSTPEFGVKPGPMPGSIALDVGIDGRVMAFGCAIATLTTILVGVWPAFRSTPRTPRPDATGGVAREKRGRLPSGGLIVVQTAFVLVLVVTASLFARTLRLLETRPLGFDPHRVLEVNVSAEATGLDPHARTAVYAQVLDAVRAVPGVTDAAAATLIPVAHGGTFMQPIGRISGAAALPPTGAQCALNVISPDWFTTLAVPILEGRDFASTDRTASRPVAIVNRAFVTRFLQGADAVGRRIQLFLPGPPPPDVEVVGVVADSIYGSLRDPVQPTLYLPLAQRDGVWIPFLGTINLSIRTTSGVADTKSIESAIVTAQPSLRLTFKPLMDLIDDTLSQERAVAAVAVTFAALGSLLALVGLYGVVAFGTIQRRGELAVRQALGATPATIVRLVAGRTGIHVIVGLVLGIGATLSTSRFIAALLYGVAPQDPLIVASVAGGLAILAALASLLPAWRVTRGDVAPILREV
jgi:predicted permease